MTANKRKQKEATSKSIPKTFKRACLANLPGSTVLSKDLAKILKVPGFIATLEVRQWKQEATLVRSYFQHTDIPENTSNQLITVLNGALQRIIKNENADAKLKCYSVALVRQFKTEKSKQRFNMEYRKLFNGYQVEKLEEEAQTEARVISRILTTVEAKAHRKNTQSRLDQLIKHDETDRYTDDNAHSDLESGSEDENDCPSEEETAGELSFAFTQAFADDSEAVGSVSSPNGNIDDLFAEEEEFPTLKVVKEKSIYKYQAPAQNIVSPHKPIIQAIDLGVLKDYFDICIGTNQDKATEETKQEFVAYMNEQNLYKSLKEMPAEIYDKLLTILQIQDRLKMKKIIMDLPAESSAFTEFVQYALLDFTLNLSKPSSFDGKNDERSIFCEVFIPIFKAFGNCLSVLNFTWCEKKAKDADYVWLVSNDFSKRNKDNLKLIDGVGTLTKINSTYLLMESSGFNHTSVVSHSLNDTLKNIKNGHDNLKYLFSQYRNASFNTIKKVNIFSCQIIENKITLIKYAVKSRTTWKVVECRSASVPLTIESSLYYVKVFELFAFMLNNIQKQQSVFNQLKLENLGLVPVPKHETVAHCLL
ncbi:hypothetical protein A0J61_02221 [Choanephora cucurbitarum]|uniref:Uncharacterized protein n=1 Tax=Choanephora cucurbitarum TaxID=101091 RepID=A0A1C7NL94_9FUNG|nr:hypothetical protein A0J61_02221 [Choanephora cucurbitarum]